MNIIGTALADGVLSVYIGGRRYLLPVSKGKKGKELVEELAKVINADTDAPFTAIAAEVSGDNAEGLKGSMGVNARFIGECSAH
ncbi:phage tail sheath domain protein, partial [Escherichia coli 2-474-04_S3_C1]